MIRYVLFKDDVPEIKAKAGDIVRLNAVTSRYLKHAAATGTAAKLAAKKAQMAARKAKKTEHKGGQ